MIMNEARYTIVGNDGKQYGPVGVEQLRAWLKQTRVDGRTPVFVAGTSDWTFLGLLPEFAADFASPPPIITAPKPSTAHPSRTNPMALWGFICSLLAWCICCCFPLALLGLVFSFIGLMQVNNSQGAQDGRGLAIVGICLSATNLLWSFGFTLLGLLDSTPNFFRNFPS